MNTEEALKILESDDSYFDSNGFHNVPIPFPVTPLEYLDFAEKDLKDETTRGSVNGLSNAKRALDARIDSLLISFGLYKRAKSENWNIPRKIERIKKLGVLAPRVLGKLNRTRNLIEHEFHKPSVDQVEDFVDVVSLFFEATKIYLYSVPNDAYIQDEKSGNGIKFVLDYEEGSVTLGVLQDSNKITFENPHFDRIIDAYAQIIKRWYQ